MKNEYENKCMGKNKQKDDEKKGGVEWCGHERKRKKNDIKSCFSTFDNACQTQWVQERRLNVAWLEQQLENVIINSSS